MTSSDVLAELSAAGVAVWLDDINRERLTGGGLAALARARHVVGVTSNPTIFDHALSHADLYNEQLAELALRGVSAGAASRAITTYDVRWACDVLRPTYDATSGVDGRVSLEVDPRLAGDTVRTIAEARALWWQVDRPNLFIKIPATPAGLPAITQCLAEGISINVTLIFSLERYGEVIDAFFAGMEQAAEAGHDLSSIASVASFFVSRVDTEVDRRLDKMGTPEAAALHGKGARLQRPLWASTSTKDPAYPDTKYVVELVAPDTVNTMPESTILAVADHAVLHGNAVSGTYEEARKVFDELAELGIGYEDVVTVLEEEGVSKFAASWQELLETIQTELERQ